MSGTTLYSCPHYGLCGQSLHTGKCLDHCVSLSEGKEYKPTIKYVQIDENVNRIDTNRVDEKILSRVTPNEKLIEKFKNAKTFVFSSIKKDGDSHE